MRSHGSKDTGKDHGRPNSPASTPPCLEVTSYGCLSTVSPKGHLMNNLRMWWPRGGEGNQRQRPLRSATPRSTQSAAGGRPRMLNRRRPRILNQKRGLLSMSSWLERILLHLAPHNNQACIVRSIILRIRT